MNPIVSAILLAVGLFVGMLACMEFGRRYGLRRMAAFAAITALTLYVIMDLEYPRMGLIRVDAADQLLIDVRGGMK